MASAMPDQSAPIILHLDLDAFFAAVEQAICPELRGQPVAVGSGVVASCSYEAKGRGVKTGMPLHEALRRCPELIVRPGDYGRYLLYANRVEGICRRFTPLVEQSSLDDFYLDLTGCLELHEQAWEAGGTAAQPGAEGDSGPVVVAEAIRRQVCEATGLSCSIGLGRNKLFARLASAVAKPGGIVRIEREQESAWLARLPVEELPGVGPKIQRELEQYNIRYAGQLAELPERVPVALFGEHGRTIWLRARGIDPRPVCAVVVELRPPALSGPPPTFTERKTVASIRRETTLEQPTADWSFLRAMASYLAQRAAWELRYRRLRSQSVKLQIRYADFQTGGGSQRLDEPSADDSQFATAAYQLLSRHYTRRLPIRHLAIELARLKPDSGQLGLFDDPDRRRAERLCQAVDQIRHRFGFQAIVKGAATELIRQLEQDRRGFRLRTPSLSR